MDRDGRDDKHTPADGAALVPITGPFPLSALISLHAELQEAGVETFSDDGHEFGLSRRGTWPAGEPSYGHVFVRQADAERCQGIVKAFCERWREEEEAKRGTCPRCGCTEGRKLWHPGCGGCLAVAALSLILLVAAVVWHPFLGILVFLWLCWQYHRLATYAYKCPACMAKWR